MKEAGSQLIHLERAAQPSRQSKLHFACMERNGPLGDASRLTSLYRHSLARDKFSPLRPEEFEQWCNPYHRAPEMPAPFSAQL